MRTARDNAREQRFEHSAVLHAARQNEYAVRCDGKNVTLLRIQLFLTSDLRRQVLES
jgi:hypothetical protein